MRVALTGATGIVGGFVVRRLLREGVAVRALLRDSGSAAAPLPPPVETVIGAMADGAALARLTDGADAVVHCAYDHLPGRYRGGEGSGGDERLRFWQANLLGGVQLLDCARAAGARRCVVLSSRAVFGSRSGGDWVDDEPRPLPDTHYGALKLSLEAHAAAFSDADGLCCASLRPTGVYGLVVPAERSKWFGVARALLRGESLPPARLATEVHGADVADAVWRLLTAPAQRVAARAFNCSDLALDSRRVMAGLARRLGVSAALPPPADNPLRQAMRCDALHALGWRPGGAERFEATLDRLAEAARADY